MENKERIESSYNSETYTDEEVRRIAYKYMVYRSKHHVTICVCMPILLFLALSLALVGASTSLTVFYGLAGLFGVVSIVCLCTDIYTYKTYKKEEQRLRNEYGDEFLERATWFKKKRKD